MQHFELDKGVFAAAMPAPGHLSLLVRHGFRTIIDALGADACPHESVHLEAASQEMGAAYHRVVLSGLRDEASLSALGEILESSLKPVIIISSTGVQGATAYLHLQRMKASVFA